MATDNRFIKIGGAFQRPDLMAGQNALSALIMPRTLDLSAVNSEAPAKVPAARSVQVPAAAPRAAAPMPQAQPGGQYSFADPGTSDPSGDAPAEDGNNPIDSFNILMTNLLKGAQGVSTADLLKRKRELQRAVLGETSAITPEEDRTLTPEQQAAIRSGKTNALSPEIDDNAYQIEKAQQSIDNFFKVFDEAQKIGQDFADKMVAPSSVIENAKKVIEANPDSMSTVLAGFNDKSKQKIIEALDYSRLGGSAGGKIVTIDGKQYVQNADGSFETPNVPTAPKSESPAFKRIKTLIQELTADPNLPAVTGIKGISNFIPGSASQLTKNKLNELIASLSLAGRSQLKGSGAISDFESKMLERASNFSIGTNLSNEDLKTQLTSLLSSLSEEETGGSGGSSGGGVVHTTAGDIDTNW